MLAPEQIRQRLEQAATIDQADLLRQGPPKPPRGGKSAAKDRPPEDPDRSLLRNELEYAAVFVEEHFEDIRYCPSMRGAAVGQGSGWFIWDGRVWQPDIGTAIMEKAKQTALSITRRYLSQIKDLSEQKRQLQSKVPPKGEDDEEVQQVRKAINALLEAGKKDDPAVERYSAKLKLLREGRGPLDDKDPAVKAVNSQIRQLNSAIEQIQTKRKLESIESLARSDARILIQQEQLDADDDILNCTNGIVDLRTGELKPHRREAYCTYICGCDYEQGYEDPALQQVLQVATRGDGDLQRYLQLTLGQACFGHNRLERFYLAAGPGGSGKGTLFEGIKVALGTYCMTAEFESFIKVPGHRIRDDLARLHSARLVLSSEIEKGQQLAAATVKAITGGDTITARRLYGTYFEFRPKLTLVLQCNDLPRVDDQDSGIWRRLVAMPFAEAIPDDARDPSIKDRLFDRERGAKAILAWLVAGAVQTYGCQRITPPAAVTRATAEYREEMNPIVDFMRDYIRFAGPLQYHETYISQAGMAEAYERFITEEQIPSRFKLSPKRFAERLRNAGCKNQVAKTWGGKKRKCWIGVTLAERGDYSDHCGDSYLPGIREHLEVLHRAIGRTSGTSADQPTGSVQVVMQAATYKPGTSGTSDSASVVADSEKEHHSRAEKKANAGDTAVWDRSQTGVPEVPEVPDTPPTDLPDLTNWDEELPF